MRGSDPIYMDVRQGELTAFMMAMVHHSLEREYARRIGKPTPIPGLLFKTTPSKVEGWWRVSVRT